MTKEIKAGPLCFHRSTGIVKNNESLAVTAQGNAAVHMKDFPVKLFRGLVSVPFTLMNSEYGNKPADLLYSRRFYSSQP